jgi:hypothetical protein
MAREIPAYASFYASAFPFWAEADTGLTGVQCSSSRSANSQSGTRARSRHGRCSRAARVEACVCVLLLGHSH